MHLHLSASHLLNPDQQNMAQPLQLSVLQLQKTTRLQKTTYRQLMDAPMTVLDADLIDKQTYLIKPGEQRTLEVAIDADTKYVALVCGFQATKHWYELINLSASQRWHYLLRLHPRSFTVIKEDLL